MANSIETFKLPGYADSNFSAWSNDLSVNPILAENDGRAGIDNIGAWQTFDRFYSVNVSEDEMSTNHYIFMCRPDLYIFEEDSETTSNATLSNISKVGLDPYFQYLSSQHPQILSSLSLNFGGIGTNEYGDNQGSSRSGAYLSSQHKFIPYITSRIESLQLPDYTLKQNTITQPYTKYSFPYTLSGIESTTGGSFEINFREDGGYSIHKLFFAWVQYQNNVMRNIFRPKDRYVQYNALDYATSIYDIMVDATGENIIYWGKYTGVVPTNVPMSNFSFNRGGSPPDTVSISFSYFVHEHLDQNILLDFNYNSLGYAYMEALPNNQKLNPNLNTVPIYDSTHFLGRNLVGRPVIQTGVGINGKPQFKLRWLE